MVAAEEGAQGSVHPLEKMGGSISKAKFVHRY